MTHRKTIIKIDKTIYLNNKKVGEAQKKVTTSFAITNFRDTAKNIHDIALKHWQVETMHFHKDKL